MAFFGFFAMVVAWCLVRPVDGTALNLQADRLSLAYKRRLGKAAVLFSQWCQRRGASTAALSKDPVKMNSWLIQYLQTLYDTHRPFWLAKHTVLAMQTLFRPLKGQLRQAWDSVGTWRLQKPVQSRTPMRLEIMTALAFVAVLHATVLDMKRCREWMAFSVALRVGWWSLLRPKELFGLKRGHLRLPSVSSFGGLRVAVLTIVNPKNKAFMGRLQVRMMRDEDSLAWLGWHCASLETADLLWPYSRQLFVKLLRDALRFFDLEHLGLTPGSLRAGGATHMLETGVPVQNIKYAGGWASDRSLASYLQEAEAANTLLSMTDPQSRRLEVALTELAFLRRPPSTGRDNGPDARHGSLHGGRNGGGQP